MEPHEIERLRRSIVMLPAGHSAGALTRESAIELLEELTRLDSLTSRYQEVIVELRRVLMRLDHPSAGMS